ncbi:MAG: hypothetical protein H6712_25920 [Myxococcales bacterium]|nr:hypothetical protein [Myxococcales bacterium]MCB9717313.1 hypothetical protein [Myxococcales bacterium]
MRWCSSRPRPIRRPGPVRDVGGSWLGAPALAIALLGCPAEPSGDTRGASTSTTMASSPTTSGTTTREPATTSPTTTTDASSTIDDNGDGCILGCDDGPVISFECDLFARDCPVGDKCMPWANDGGPVWNATRCSPLPDDPAQVGESCMVEGSGVSGIDDCDIHSMCWDVDPETNMGTCVAMCSGNEANALCEDPGTTCAIYNQGALLLCLHACEPLLQDCPGGQACLPSQASWTCVPDASGPDGAYGSPCEHLNGCDPGLVCLGLTDVPTCSDSPGCCLELCDVSDPLGDAQCTGVAEGQICVPWFAPAEAPAGYEDVGVCNTMDEIDANERVATPP